MFIIFVNFNVTNWKNSAKTWDFEIHMFLWTPFWQVKSLKH